MQGENGTADGKDPLFGHVDGFQIGLKSFFKILIEVQYGVDIRLSCDNRMFLYSQTPDGCFSRMTQDFP